MYQLPVSSPNSFGEISEIEVPGIGVTLVNRGKLDINISNTVLLVNNIPIDIFPYGFFDKRTTSGIPYKKIDPIPPGRNYKFSYFGQAILDAIGKAHKKKISISVSNNR